MSKARCPKTYLPAESTQLAGEYMLFGLYCFRYSVNKVCTLFSGKTTKPLCPIFAYHVVWRKPLSGPRLFGEGSRDWKWLVIRTIQRQGEPVTLSPAIARIYLPNEGPAGPVY